MKSFFFAILSERAITKNLQKIIFLNIYKNTLFRYSSRYSSGFVLNISISYQTRDLENFPLSFCYYYIGREIVTESGPIQEFKIEGIKNIGDDPIFSVSGDIAMNWWYADNGVRIALDGGHLSNEDVNDDNTHGLGNHLAVNGKNGVEGEEEYKIEISNIQDCPFFDCDSKKLKVQGKNHGGASELESVPIYGNYAIYVSQNATMFPIDKNLTLLIKSKKVIVDTITSN